MTAVLLLLGVLLVRPPDLLAAGDPPPPVDTVSDFLPEDANLSDCLGFVERPGCGSDARGGTGQTLVFVALVAGLAIIFWRVTVIVRRGRTAADATIVEPDDTTSPRT